MLCAAYHPFYFILVPLEGDRIRNNKKDYDLWFDLCEETSVYSYGLYIEDENN